VLTMNSVKILHAVRSAITSIAELLVFPCLQLLRRALAVYEENEMNLNDMRSCTRYRGLADPLPITKSRAETS